MSATDILLIIVSGLGVIHGLYLAIFLWLYPKGNSLSNKLLTALLLVLSFRVGKSVFLYSFLSNSRSIVLNSNTGEFYNN